MTPNGVIGNNNRIPFTCSADQQLFRSYTLNKHLVMGRKTYMGLNKPLEDRNIIVVSSANVRNHSSNEPTAIVRSVQEALLVSPELSEIWICGGERIYKEALPDAHHMHLTIVKQNCDGDTYFPAVSWEEWRRVSEFDFEDYMFISYYNENNIVKHTQDRI